MGICGVTPLLIRLKAPSLREFSHEGKALDLWELAVQKSLEQLETLKKSLMQKYFG